MNGGTQWTHGGGWLMPDALARELVRDESPLTDAERGAVVSAFLSLAMGLEAEIPTSFLMARETFKAYAETAREAREKYEARKERERRRMQERRGGPDIHGNNVAATRGNVAATRGGVAATRGGVAATRGDVACRIEGNRIEGNRIEGNKNVVVVAPARGARQPQQQFFKSGKDAADFTLAENPPTIAEVADALRREAEAKGVTIDAEAEARKLIAYNEARGWKMGHAPLRSIGGVVRSWLSNIKAEPSSEAEPESHFICP